MPIDEELDQIIAAGASKAELKACARAQGYKSIAEDGIGKVLTGEIDIPSLLRAVDLTARL